MSTSVTSTGFIMGVLYSSFNNNKIRFVIIEETIITNIFVITVAIILLWFYGFIGCQIDTNPLMV